MAQTITKKIGEDIIIVDEVVIPPDPPPTGNCECDVQAGTTTTLAPGSPATVTSRKIDKTIFFDFGVPEGLKGDKGDSTWGTGSAARATFDVMDNGAKGDGVTDDRQAFQTTIDKAIAARGTIIIPPPNNHYRINSQLNVASPTNQVWMNIEARLKAGDIKYYGSNSACFKITGLKSCRWKGLCIELQGSNAQAIDVITTQSANSSSFPTFANFYLNLNKGVNNIGIRTGFQSPGDISNYNFENMIVFGGGVAGNPNVAISGQYAFQNLGVNTLSMAWFGGFVAYCDRVYTNISADGQSRGNGSVSFNDLGTSQNNEDFVFAWEQGYKISGRRFEAGNRFLRVTGNGAYSHISVENVTVHDYRGINGNVVQIDGPCAVTLNNSTFAKTDGGKYASPITLNAGGKFGALSVKQCSFTSDVVYTKPGNTSVDIELRGNVKLGPGFQAIGAFPNQ